MTAPACMVVIALMAGTDTSAIALKQDFQAQHVEMVWNDLGTTITYQFNIKFNLFFAIAAATVKFNGENALSLRYPAGISNEADDIVIRFRTTEQVCEDLITFNLYLLKLNF